MGEGARTGRTDTYMLDGPGDDAVCDARKDARRHELRAREEQPRRPALALFEVPLSEEPLRVLERAELDGDADTNAEQRR